MIWKQYQAEVQQNDFDRDREPVRRVEANGTAQCEAPEKWQRVLGIAHAVGDDEAADDEENFHAEVSVRQQVADHGDTRDTGHATEVEHDNEHGGDAAQPVDDRQASAYSGSHRLYSTDWSLLSRSGAHRLTLIAALVQSTEGTAAIATLRMEPMMQFPARLRRQNQVLRGQKIWDA